MHMEPMHRGRVLACCSEHHWERRYCQEHYSFMARGRLRSRGGLLGRSGTSCSSSRKLGVRGPELRRSPACLRPCCPFCIPPAPAFLFSGVARPSAFATNALDAARLVMPGTALRAATAGAAAAVPCAAAAGAAAPAATGGTFRPSCASSLRPMLRTLCALPASSFSGAVAAAVAAVAAVCRPRPAGRLRANASCCADGCAASSSCCSAAAWPLLPAAFLVPFKCRCCGANAAARAPFFSCRCTPSPSLEEPRLPTPTPCFVSERGVRGPVRPQRLPAPPEGLRARRAA